MLLSQFQFNLPPERIAQEPAEPRDSARLFAYDRARGSVTHARVSDLPSLLPPDSLLVANNSRVRKARLFGLTDAGKPVELLVLEKVAADAYRCMVGGRGTKVGTRITAHADKERRSPVPLSGMVVGREELPGMTCFTVRFSGDVEPMLEKYGHTPLPPYIRDSHAADDRYQTVYARDTGSAAAPTAGLHFTPGLMSRLAAAGIGWAEVTLHVGLGTFLPLREEAVEDNRLHAEQTFIPDATADAIRKAGRVVAVGTTSTRTIESHSGPDGIVPGAMETSMFIHPGYRFRTVNALMTNFHLPHSSLLMLVAAFLGNAPDNSRLTMEPDEMARLLMRLYAEAIDENYRFFSFGDAMLIL